MSKLIASILLALSVAGCFGGQVEQETQLTDLERDGCDDFDGAPYGSNAWALECLPGRSGEDESVMQPRYCGDDSRAGRVALYCWTDSCEWFRCITADEHCKLYW